MAPLPLVVELRLEAFLDLAAPGYVLGSGSDDLWSARIVS